MSTVTTDLLNARIETIETRMDARILAIETAIAGAIQFHKELRADIKNLKTTVIVTAIASVLAVGAINATILSNMVAAFESGKNTAAAQAEVTKQVEHLTVLVQKMREEQRQKPK
ncbi:hypothetical protein ACXZ1M_27505 [Duganella sp. PWIR1]|jgi:high-affinity nickel permease